jgi:hypothetical protein
LNARGRRPGPGKFEACNDLDAAESLYDQVMQSFQDDEVGSVQELGWYGLILNSGIPGAEIAIVNEDSNGFFTYQVFDNEADAYNRWEKIQEMYEDYYEDSEDEGW